MKTILIIIGGIAEIPPLSPMERTALKAANTPSLDLLAEGGALGCMKTGFGKKQFNDATALLSIFGYDERRGIPSHDLLREFGLDNSIDSSYTEINYMVIPGFSGHGSVITTSPIARAVGKMAFLSPVDIYSPGGIESEMLEEMARQAVVRIKNEEFVFVYVNTPHSASIKGDYEGKKRAIEMIDRHLITPVADYVWRTDEFMNLAVTSDHISSCVNRNIENGMVPAVVYFNDHTEYKARGFDEQSAMNGELELKDPSDLMKFLNTFSPKFDEE